MTQRNLVCHIYPRIAGAHWMATVDHLRARWLQFTGRKVVCVTTDETTHSPDDVARRFADSTVEILSRQNSPLQEVESLPHLLNAVSGEPGITLYCHAKGCTHLDPASASHVWRDAMAAATLDYPDLVDCALAEQSTCGAFRSTQPIGWSGSPWHFAGTWFWFRNADLFGRNWGDFEQTFWGVESYPGKHFAHHESRCLFFDSAETAHLYSPDWWRVHIGPAFRAWRRRLLNRCGLSPICSDPPLSLLGREVLA